MSLYMFWSGVVVVAVFGLCHLAGWEYENRQRWQEWERRRRGGRS